MKILVTGGAGFIASHLIKRLLDDGHEIVCVDNLNDYYDPELKLRRLEQFEKQINFEKIDITDFRSLKGIFEKYKFDKIAHLAAQAGVRYSITHPDVYVNTNYLGTFNIFELAKMHGIKDLVFASTSSVYGESLEVPFKENSPADRPVSIYAATKRACEIMASSYVRNSDMNITCLRFFTVYGPFGRPDMALFKFTKNILAGEPIDVYNNGEMKRDFTFVSDIVEGFVLALNKPMGFEIINLGHGEPVHLLKFIEVLEKKLDRKAEINFMPMQQGDVPQTFADTVKAQKKLGFDAKIRVEEGVSLFVNWFKNYYKI
jgi:UDP-glucuronate 4-epimerase